MGGDTLSYEIKIDSRGRAVVYIYGLNLIDPDSFRPLGIAISKILRRSFAATIAAEGRPSRYAPLARSTIARKKALGQPLTPLVATGAMRNSLARRNFRGNVTYVTASGTLIVGTNIPYARYHQTGTQNADGSIRMPARPFLVILPDDWGAIKDLVKAWQLGNSKVTGDE